MIKALVRFNATSGSGGARTSNQGKAHRRQLLECEELSSSKLSGSEQLPLDGFHLNRNWLPTMPSPTPKVGVIKNTLICHFT